MERIREIFEELNFPGVERLKKALKNRGIPFTKEQVNEVAKGESVRQIQQAAPRLTGKVASHYENYEWMADLVDWTTAPSQYGAAKKKTRRSLSWSCKMSSVGKDGQRLSHLNSQQKSNEPSNGSLTERMSYYHQTD